MIETVTTKPRNTFSSKRLPNLIIAGVRKAGTTSLFHYLSQHPDICPCQVKEPSYFVRLKYQRELAPFDDYLKLFDHAQDQRFLMEASPGYFSGGADIALPLARALDRPYTIVILRDPIDVVWSNYNFLRSRLRLDKEVSFEEYLDLSLQHRSAGTDRLRENQDYNSLLAGLYSLHLPAWCDVLGDRLKVVFFDDLIQSPSMVVETLCEWLGIDSQVSKRLDYSVENKTEQYRLASLQHLALVINRSCKPIFRHMHPLKKSLRRVYYLVNRDSGPKSVMSDTCREVLREFFAESNKHVAAHLSELSDRPLPHWLHPT